MKIFRRSVIAIFDLVIIILIIRILTNEDPVDDAAGLAGLITIVFFVLYNLYSWLVYALFARIKQKHFLIEIGFFLLSLLPFYFLLRFFNNGGFDFQPGP